VGKKCPKPPKRFKGLGVCFEHLRILNFAANPKPNGERNLACRRALKAQNITENIKRELMTSLNSIIVY
jgi:hypothetical protein